MKNCNSKYAGHTGTESYHRYFLNFLLSDGALNVAQSEQCFWFLDILISAQTIKGVRDEEFQSWFLFRKQDDQFEVIGTNGNWIEDVSKYPNLDIEANNQNIIYKQDIPFSDFEFDRLSLYLDPINKVIYLPSEY